MSAACLHRIESLETHRASDRHQRTMNVDDFLKRDLNRRQFLGKSAQNAAGVAAGMVGLAGAAALAQGSAAERLHIAVIGVRNQGKALASGFA